MNEILNYMENNQIFFWMMLAVLILAAFFLWMYRKEKRKADRLEASVKNERRFYGGFSENQKECFLILGCPDLEVLYISPNFESLTGIDPEYVKADLEVVQGLVSQQAKRKIRKRIEEWDQTESMELETAYCRRGETDKRYGKLLIDRTSDEQAYVAAFTDITEEYEVRQSLKEDLLMAQRQSQQKTDFLSKMSHEIRTPMNGIIGMLDLIKAHLDDRKTAEDYLKRTADLSQFLLTLINDILDMSRIESGKMELEHAPFSLTSMAEKLDSMFRSTAEAKGIHWSVRMLDFDVHYVIGDEMRLSQVIINFVSNANKFTPAGGSVDVTFRQMDKIDGELHLMIRVRDTGKGIKEDFISKIFRPFEQEDASTARNYGGSGLGMAIADNIIKLMNGQILVESEEGKGSEFSVYVSLPIAEELEAAQTAEYTEAAAHEEAARKQAVDSFSMEGLKIMLAEDNDINAEIATEILEMDGVHVTRVCDGMEALQTFANSEPGTFDVILMDIQMPNLDGWQATEEIRKLTRPDAATIPIFAMSANAFLEDRRHSLAAGMNGHINKPVDFEQVRQIIGDHMYTVRSR